MRAVFAVALCFVLGACAGGEPDPYGMYDVVSVTGEGLLSAEATESWVELRADGTGTMFVVGPEVPEPTELPFTFSLGQFENGCYPYESQGGEGVMWTGSICGDEFTSSNPEMTVVMHKRR